MKAFLIILLVGFACFAAAPDVPVYPGATIEDQVTKATRQNGANNIAYNSPDSFEKVDGFYKKLASQDVPHSRNINADMKFVVLRFPGKKFQVGLSWNVNDKRHGTVIQFIEKP